MREITGFHHVAIITADLEAGLAFWRDGLGFEELGRKYREARDSWKVDLRHPCGATLELFTFPDAPARPTRPEAMGLRHLALAVDDFAAAVSHLADRGISIEEIRTDTLRGKRFTFCADPDGLPVEIYER